MTRPPTTRNMGRSKGPMPSISRLSLPTRARTAWHRAIVKVIHLLGNAPPDGYATHEPIRPFPYEIAEMIVANLIADIGNLKAFSLTCRSWYFVAAPHLHHTLTLKMQTAVSTDSQPNPPPNRDGLEPLVKLHELGLIPLVGEIRVEQARFLASWFVPRGFDRRSLRCFSAFANVHTLRIQRLEIGTFTPGIERYFKQFSPSVRSITLYDSQSTPQQLSHFLSLFSKLDDIELRHTVTSGIEPTKLIPFSTPGPKLGGRLVLYDFSWVETWTHLIASCGGLRFRDIDLRRDATCAPVLLEACAETLETLRFNLTDGSDRSHFATKLGAKLNLSRLKALRSLQIGAWPYEMQVGEYYHSMVVEIFSTITSPVFSELVIALDRCETSLSWSFTMFRALHSMNGIRPFKLVFLLEDTNFVEARRELMDALGSVVVKRILNFLGSQPTIRRGRPSRRGWDVTSSR